MFITGSSDILPLPPAVGRNDVSKIEASKQSFESDPSVREDTGVRYFSPVVRIDPDSQQAIIIFREADGEITRQYPSEEELKEYRKNNIVSSGNDNATSSVKDSTVTTPAQNTKAGASSVRESTVSVPTVDLPEMSTAVVKTTTSAGGTDNTSSNNDIIV